jgi:hypothetical protein
MRIDYVKISCKKDVHICCTNFAKQMERNLHETTSWWKTYGKWLFSEDVRDEIQAPPEVGCNVWINAVIEHIFYHLNSQSLIRTICKSENLIYFCIMVLLFRMIGLIIRAVVPKGNMCMKFLVLTPTSCAWLFSGWYAWAKSRRPGTRWRVYWRDMGKHNGCRTGS